MAFIGGSLLRKESLDVAKIYLEQPDWSVVRDKVLSENLLQSKRLSSAKRFVAEIISRLSVLDAAELDRLVVSGIQEQGYILWLAICRRYQFVAEFATELLHERYVSLRNELTQEDFESFMNKKAEWHPEIDKLTDNSRNKVRQILFRTLKDADLLSKDNQIQAAMFSPSLREAISRRDARELLYFPVFENETAVQSS